jgi:hypothetical protein
MPGHVFVVQGSLSHLDYDAVIVPTDADFSVLGHWAEVLGATVDANRQCEVDQLKPEDWPRRGWGRAREHGRAPAPLKPTWFIDAAWYTGQAAEEALQGLTDRLAAILREIGRAGLTMGHGRPHALVALPTLGTGAGGFDSVRGEVIDALLSTCQAAVDTATGFASIDVVIVASRPSNYTAFQARRRALPHHRSHLGADLHAAATTVAGLAADGELALFLGAGVGIPAGLPSWKELLKELATKVEGDIGNLVADGKPLLGLDSDLDKAELLHRELGAQFGEAVVDFIGQPRKYAITHAMLASLGCSEVVTTNYDQLYEVAAKDVVKGREITTLPFEHTRAHTPWILKMHGDVRSPSSIVLSRSDFVAYDATSRPLGSVVQSLMVTKHLLVVGASMTDDNFLRLAHQVIAFRAAESTAAAGTERRPIGTVLTLTPQPLRERLWKDRFTYVAISDKPDVAQQARDLAIFLDLVALLTAGNSHLIDPRYQKLLGSEAERAAAEAARSLVAAIDDLPPDAAGPWAALRDELGEWGGDDRPAAVDIV